MHCLRFHITTRSPLIISTISGDMNMVTTERFIPGTTVLGVLVRRFIEKQKDELKGRPAHQNDTFYSWFLSGNINISNAYIFSQDEYGDYDHYPTPLSIEKEKYGELVYDLLNYKEELIELTEYLGDFCLLNEDFIQTLSVETNISFHHARDREKGVSKEGLIFNYESISSNQIFEGTILGEENDLKNLLNICGSSWTAFIGRSRNSQYGTAEFEFIKVPIPAIQSQIIWPKNEEGNPAKYISMTLLSDLILYNEYGYPTTDVEDLLKVLKKSVSDLAIEKAFVKKREIENFVGIWKLKRPSEVCFTAGSTFLLKVNSDDRERLIEIQQNGIGERINEGFGRCAFGMQVHPMLNLRDEAKEKPSKPEDPLPEIARKILTEIAQDAVTKSIELQAINKQEEFARLPSNSLISRLEAMIRRSHSHIEFVENISKLRKIAKDQLERCVSREYNLLDFLKNSENVVDWKNFCRDPRNTELKSLCDEIELNPDKNEKLMKKLLQAYFVTFFSTMRKRVEREGDNV